MNAGVLDGQFGYFSQVIGGITNPLGEVDTIWEVVSNGLNIINPIAAILFVAMFVYAGATYIMSAGDAGKVKSAQAMMTNALIGLVIIAFAFVVQKLVDRGLFGGGNVGSQESTTGGGSIGGGPRNR